MDYVDKLHKQKWPSIEPTNGPLFTPPLTLNNYFPFVCRYRRANVSTYGRAGAKGISLIAEIQAGAKCGAT